MSIYTMAVEELRTGVGQRLRQFLVMRFEKQIIARRLLRKVEDAILVDVGPAMGRRIVAALATKAASLYERILVKKFPQEVVDCISRKAFADLVGLAALPSKGEYAMESLVGLVTEKLIPDMAQLKALHEEARLLAKATKGWGKPILVDGTTTTTNRAFGDLLIVSVQEDSQRVWVMAIIESKSISNTGKLVRVDRKPGQFLWDEFRARAEGLRFSITNPETGAIHRYSFEGKQLDIGRVPVGKKLADGRFTKFIAVVPRDLTEYDYKRLALDGIKPDRWEWPVDAKTLTRVVREVKGALEIDNPLSIFGP